MKVPISKSCSDQYDALNLYYESSTGSFPGGEESLSQCMGSVSTCLEEFDRFVAIILLQKKTVTAWGSLTTCHPYTF